MSKKIRILVNQKDNNEYVILAKDRKVVGLTTQNNSANDGAISIEKMENESIAEQEFEKINRRAKGMGFKTIWRGTNRNQG